MGTAESPPRLGKLILYYTGGQISSPFPALRPSFKVFRHEFPLIQREGHPLDLLNSLMPLPRQHDHIPGPPLGQSPANGLPPVGLHMDLPAGAAHSGQNILDDGPGILGPGVVRGDHRHIRSRSPPQPNRQISRPAVKSRAVSRTFSRALGVWA